MSADLRIAFVYRYVERMTVVEIAEVFGVSRATMTRRMARARARFMKLSKHEPRLLERIASSTSFEVEHE